MLFASTIVKNTPKFIDLFFLPKEKFQFHLKKREGEGEIFEHCQVTRLRNEKIVRTCFLFVLSPEMSKKRSVFLELNQHSLPPD